MTDSPNKRITGNNWQVDFFSSNDKSVEFSFENNTRLTLLSAKINDFSEHQALLNYARNHQKEDQLSARFESKATIPFGSEPIIKHSLEFTNGTAKVITDIEPGKHDNIRSLSLGKILLEGDWRKIAVNTLPQIGQALPEPQWHDLGTKATNENIIFDSEIPFLNCLVEDKNGNRFELGCGDDLWRWQSGVSLENCISQFKVVASQQSVVIERIPLSFGEDAEAPKRAWRFKWYFAWSNMQNNEQATSPIIISPSKLNLPLQAQNSQSNTPCYAASTCRKLLRKKIRSLLSKSANTTVILENAEPHLCSAASHLGRNSQNSMPHWDLWDLLELYLWSNRKALKAGNFFALMAPPNNAASQYPSMHNLASPAIAGVTAD